MDRFTGRRKLIRGSLSAPLVLTVASPAALARQSFEACMYRASKQIPQNLEVFSATRDGFLREAVTLYEGKLKSDTGPELFTRKVVVVANSGKGNPTKTLFFKVSDCLQTTGYGEKDFEHNNAPSPVTRYQLVYVNERGDKIRAGLCGSPGGFPVTGSCWASFGGGPSHL